MSAYIKTAPRRGDFDLAQCSDCGSLLTTQHDPATFIKFCWNCGEKFGPEPKAEPTPGEWYYDKTGERIYSKHGRSTTSDEAIAEVYDQHVDQETYANGYLMAASKKLLAACKVISLTPGIRDYLMGVDPKAIQQVERAIVDAHPPK